MGNALMKPILSKIFERIGSPVIRAASCSMNGFRTTMEDAHAMSVTADRVILGIFDGHLNDKCSNYIAEHLPRKLNQLQLPITPQKAVDICIDLDAQFLEDVKAGGSTATFCILTDMPPEAPQSSRKKYQLMVCNVGDSRTLVVRNGSVIFATIDHKPNDPTELQRIKECGGMVQNARLEGDLSLSRAFGDHVFKQNASGGPYKQKVIAVPDVNVVEVQEDDIIVLACDGVFEGTLKNEQVAKFVAEHMENCHGDFAVVAGRLCDEALRCGSKDNISCIVARITDGSKFVEEFGASDFVPGAPYARSLKASRSAYAAMATLAQTSLARALRSRFALLQAFNSNTMSKLPLVMQIAFDMSDETELEIERNFFGKGPAAGNEEEFFESLAAAP